MQKIRKRRHMNNRIMVKITENEDSFAVKTISRGFRCQHIFYILKSELEKMFRDGSVIVRDILSYANLRYHKSEKIEITFSWLDDSGNSTLTGRTETVYLPYDIFDSYENGNGRKVLSILDKLPKIKFQSQNNLHNVVRNTHLRNKLGKFLDRNFKWVDYNCIVIYDDFLPYNFFFETCSLYGKGICGGIILHGVDNLETAYYSIHT